MDTYMTFKAYGEGADEALSAVSDEAIALDRLLSATDELVKSQFSMSQEDRIRA